MNCERDDAGFRCGACSHSGECPAKQACIANIRTGSMECVASECDDDQHCFPGTVCRVAERTAAGEPVRRCLIAGERNAGERCVPAAFTSGSACREALVCIDGLCAPRCRTTESDCAAGTVCRESVSGAITDGAGCVPDCSKLGCARGLRCVPVRAGVHQCLQLTVDQCASDQDCPGNQHCLTEWFGDKGGRYCAASCESWRTDACPAGFVCGTGGPSGSSCYRACGGAAVCPAGFLCKSVTEDLQSWGCRVDYNG